MSPPSAHSVGGGSNMSLPTSPRGSSAPSTPRDKGAGPSSPRGAFTTPQTTNSTAQDNDNLAVFSPLRLRLALLRRLSSVFDDWTAAATHPLALHQQHVDESRASNAVAAISAIAGGGSNNSSNTSSSSSSSSSNTVFSAYAGASYRRSQSLQPSDADNIADDPRAGSASAAVAASDSKLLPIAEAETRSLGVSSPKSSNGSISSSKSNSSSSSSSRSSSAVGRPSPSSVDAFDSAASAAAAKAEQAAGADVKNLVWKV